jgi:hypothetical protein
MVASPLEFWFTDDHIPPSVTAANIRLPQRHMMTHGLSDHIVEISVCIKRLKRD